MVTLIGLCHDEKWRDIALSEVNSSFRSLLARFTPEPAAFRDMMRHTNTIISGSTALYFLHRQPCTWTPGDTDIIVAPAHFDTTLRFIMALPGAVITYDSRNVPAGLYQAIGATLDRLVKITTDMGAFDVMMSREISPYHPITHYWTTLVMNALTADFFVCAYPTLTYSHRGAIQSHSSRPVPLQKYINRGFTFFTVGGQPDLHSSCATTIACSRRHRYFGDDNCLVFPIIDGSPPLDMANTQPLNFNISSAWQLGGRPCSNINCFIPIPRVALTMIVNGGWQAGLRLIEE
ncbi:hypothetical protein QCA50_015095 [Cerrena zonata]|uniref:Uncharacterized protein n=1 Tax=Cerrena zonata TaxID=2478898 RepID=A0AAW0FKU0_9APHY